MSSAPVTLLDKLRMLSSVDCDTLDVQVAQTLGPFADCTSNQAIAYAELTKLDASEAPLYDVLIKESIQMANWLFAKQSDATIEELAVEIMMVSLALRVAPNLTGYVHVQTNPLWSYSQAKTIRNAERIIAHFKQLDPNFDTKRVCLKVPSTWEGLQACRVLESRGISTLATTLFCMEQAALAADAGCTYIAPYVNELKVHFEPGYKDPAPAFGLCALAQVFFRAHNFKTRVLPASLTSVSEVLALAGADHITVPPALLAELAATPFAGYTGTTGIGASFRAAAGVEPAEAAYGPDLVRDEAAWRMAVTRSEGGRSEGKLVDAINIFAEMQERLEALVTKFDVAGVAR